MKKGRSVGIVTLLAPEKSTGDAIPTAGAGTRAARSLHQAKHLLDS